MRATTKESIMSDLLYRVLLDREAELVNDIQRQLRHSTSRNYQHLEWETLLRRVESLVAYFLMSLRESPDMFTDYIAMMTRERISEGFYLREILMALRILEEKVWVITVEDVPREGQIAALARVTGTVGAAKDSISEIYLARADAADSRAPA
jgi:hypothetical protein